MRGLLGCLMLMGCQPTVIDAPDAPYQASDSGVPDHGLFVSWIASPALPGPVRTDLIVGSATFKLSRVQAIGDAGGDQRGGIDLTWNDGSPAPPPIALTQAPTGIYSKVTLEIDAGLSKVAYVIKGTCKVSGVTRAFEIHDLSSLGIQVSGFDMTLQPGSDVTLAIKVDLRAALESIDFGSLDTEDGHLVLDTSDPQMPDFRNALKSGFRRGN